MIRLDTFPSAKFSTFVSVVPHRCFVFLSPQWSSVRLPSGGCHAIPSPSRQFFNPYFQWCSHGSRFGSHKYHKAQRPPSQTTTSQPHILHSKPPSLHHDYAYVSEFDLPNSQNDILIQSKSCQKCPIMHLPLTSMGSSLVGPSPSDPSP